jgi:probable HAF family extracellular repeat protein
VALAINDQGTVLGQAWTPKAHGTVWHAWLWKPHADHLIRLSKRGLPQSTEPHDINSRGQVVGCTYKDDEPYHAVLWRPLSRDTVRIPSLGGEACAWGISNDREVVGWSVISGFTTRAFRWTPNMRRMQSLGTLRGPSFASDVNSDGFVVGRSMGGLRFHAFVWNPKTHRMIDLGTLLG